MSQYIRKDDNILMVGAGNSRLSEDMFDDGYTTITNIDISRVVIDQMIARYRQDSFCTRGVEQCLTAQASWGVA